MTFNKLTEPKLTYAVDSSNNLVYIDDVAKGLNCNCVCPECKEKLIAKKGKERQPHFAHCSNNPNCTGGIMSAIHWLSENIDDQGTVL